MASRFLSAFLLFGILAVCYAQSGDNVCTRKVSKKVFYTETRRVSSKQCQNNVCRTVYSLKKIVKFRIQYSTEKYCCPGFVREGDGCVPISTTALTTTEGTYTTPPVGVVDPRDPVEGAIQDGNQGAPLSEGGVIGIVLAALLVVAVAIFALTFKIRKQKKQDKEAILKQEMYRGQSLHENGVNPDLTMGGTFHNDLYDLTNQPPKEDTFNPEMYDQLHLYGNEADKVDHDYERPVRSNTIGGIPGEYYNKGRLPTPSIKSEGHQAALYENKGDVSNKVRVFERLTSQPSQDDPVGNKMLYSDVRY